MRLLEGDRQLVRIYLGESDRHHHRPLAALLLERLRQEGFAGATVFHGVAGFGANSVLHTASIERLSVDLPVVVEVVETAEQVEKLRAILDELVPDGLVTIQPVQVLRYGPKPKG